MTTSEIRKIELHFNELHQPIVVPPPKGKLSLHVHESTSTSELKSITLSGSPEALYALGNLLIGISESPGYHIHVDEDVDGKWFVCHDGFTLTIANSAKVPQKEHPTTENLPPDWAR
jgi:hypothetical protein